MMHSSTLTLSRLGVGLFAGALAAFFPRLMTVLGGSPTDDIQLFSQTYILVGALMAVSVGVIVIIIEADPARSLRDVFMTALGVPTLVIGALGTSSTTHNLSQSNQRINELSRQLASASGIVIEGPRADAAGVGGGNTGSRAAADPAAWLPLGAAHAQATSSATTAYGGQSRLGIVAQERLYITVLARSAQRSELEALQGRLDKQGQPTRIQPSANGFFDLVSQAPAQPLSEAVLHSRAAVEQGLRPVLVQASR